VLRNPIAVDVGDSPVLRVAGAVLAHGSVTLDVNRLSR
jgi:hypothetical protein